MHACCENVNTVLQGPLSATPHNAVSQHQLSPNHHHHHHYQQHQQQGRGARHTGDWSALDSAAAAASATAGVNRRRQSAAATMNGVGPGMTAAGGAGASVDGCGSWRSSTASTSSSGSGSSSGFTVRPRVCVCVCAVRCRSDVMRLMIGFDKHDWLHRTVVFVVSIARSFVILSSVPQTLTPPYCLS